MRLALHLAQRGLGRVWPNPAVGCVIVDENGFIAGRGWTQDGGRPHAETQALRQAGASARGATAYVSLEPCSHQGQTGPCADALIQAGIARVVAAVEDPDPRVSGKGIERLRAAGLEVHTGVLSGEAAKLNAGFFSRVLRNRPLVTLKLATTLDGKIALANGQSRWITGPVARQHSHLMRAQHDAVMVGIGTVLHDDPELTCRLPGLRHDRLVRIVADSQFRLPARSKLAQSAGALPVWVLTTRDGSQKPSGLADVHVISVPETHGHVDIQSGLNRLAEKGLTRVFVEGGARLASSLLKSGMVDQILWYRAPKIMGAGKDAFSDVHSTVIDELPKFIRQETIRLGEDVLETYRVAT